MQQREDIVPIGGLNTDDDPRHFEQGDYLEARNVRIGLPQDQGSGGLVETLKSTLESSVPIPGGGSVISSLNTSWLGVALDEENDFAYILSTMTVVGGTVPGVLFIITKHDLTNNTLKTIFAQVAGLWGILPYAGSYFAFYNPKVVDDNLIITDNKNDIRQFDVRRLENTYEIGLKTQVADWNLNDAEEEEYDTGDWVYYLDSVYLVLQDNIVDDRTPPEAPTLYEWKAYVVDVYLHINDPTHFTLIALPSLIAPLATYKTDSTRQINQLKGRTWQFSYRYIYLDWRKSTFAPPSLVPPPSQEENNEGVANPDQTYNNYIQVTVNSGIEEVRVVELVVRSSDDPATWFVFDEVEVITHEGARLIAPATNVNVRFYNDTLSPAITTEEVLNLFSFVPIRAKHMELIEGNRLAFGNITEGYSHIDTLVTTGLSWENLAGISSETTNWTWEWVEQSDGGAGLDWLNKFILPTTKPPNAGTIYLKRNIAGVETQITYSYTTAESWPNDVVTALNAAADAEWGASETVACFSGTNYTFCLFPRNQPSFGDPPPYIQWTIDFYIEVNIITSVKKYSTLKMGATHAWGIIYRDIAGRLGPINGTSDIREYIPFATEGLSENAGSRPVLTFNINHPPPDWAASYEILYAGNKSMSYWLQTYGYNFALGKKDHEDPDDTTGFTEVRSYRLRIKKVFSNTRNYLPGWVVEEYVWQKGDRIRIFGKVSDAGDLTEINGYIWDTEITGVFTDIDKGATIGEPTATPDEYSYEWIYFNVDADSGFVPIDTAGNYLEELLIEIYRPFVIETALYFTTGMTYRVTVDGFGNKYHEGDTDQVLNSGGVSTSPAIVTNTSHDAWKYLRSFRTNSPTVDPDNASTISLWIESQYASDYNKQQILTSQGQPIPLIESLQQNVLTKRLRHGGAISIGSQLNAIADFRFDEFLDLKDEDGPIEGLKLVGFTLKAIQYTRVISIYISRQESFTAQGDAQYLFTDRVFGSTRPSLNAWGTSHPDSVITDNRHLWFWDQSEGVVVRDAPNGQVAISDNKMKRFFTDKARAQDAISKDRQVATMAYSMETEEVFIMFSDSNATSGTDEITVMNETDQRWKAKIDIDFHYGKFYWIGKRLFTLKNYSETLFEWWRGSDYLTIAGVQRTASLGFYVVQDPAKVKTFDAIHVYQTNQRPIFSDVRVPAKATAEAEEMYTTIFDANIKEREGVFYCQVMRDKNSAWLSPIPTGNRELNGRRLRGLYMYVELQFTETTLPVTLSNITAITTPSERSK
jgi:hypothetical protein